MASAYLVLPADPGTLAEAGDLQVLAIDMKRRYGLHGLRIDPAQTPASIHGFATPPAQPSYRCRAQEMGHPLDHLEQIEEFLGDWLDWPEKQSRVLLARQF